MKLDKLFYISTHIDLNFKVYSLIIDENFELFAFPSINVNILLGSTNTLMNTLFLGYKDTI